MRISFAVAGDKQIERELMRVGAHAGDASPAFHRVGQILIEETREQFATEGGHASGGWKPLKAATLARKRAAGHDLRILHERGFLVASLTRRGDSNMIFKVEPDGITYGSKLPYAAAHQNPKPGSSLPRRRPVELTESARNRIVKVIQRWIMTGELDRV